MCVMYLNCDFSVKDPYSYENYLLAIARERKIHIYIQGSVTLKLLQSTIITTSHAY